MESIKEKGFKQLKSILSLILCLWLVAFLQTQFDVPSKIGLIVFALSASVVILDLMERKDLGWLNPIAGYIGPIIILILFVSSIYLWTNFQELYYSRAGLYTPIDLIVGAVILIIGIYLSYKTGSGFIVAFAVLMIVYMIFGRYFPGILKHPGMFLDEIIANLSVSIDKGVFGSLWVTVILYVTMFLLFSSLVTSYGGMEIVLTLGRAVALRSIMYVSQVAVWGTALMGMISGTPPAIVAALGPLLIPMMDKIGLRREDSGAIIAIGAAGGQIMPPVMGIAAFIMVAFIERSYLTIIISAFPAAAIFFSALSFSVYLLVHAQHRAFSKKEIEDMKKKIISQKIDISKEMLIGGSLAIVIALGVLIFLLIRGFNIPYASLKVVEVYIVFNLITFLIVNRKKSFLVGLKDFGQRTLNGFIDGGLGIGNMFMMIVPITIVISGMTNTALSIKIANWVLYLGENNILFVALATAFTCILFGFAVSTTGAYIVVSVILCPALIRLGIDPLVAHMFVFYYAILSNLTPPVAVSSTVAARVAEANFLKLATTAMKMGAPLFILPMVFLFYPNIMLFNAQTPLILLMTAIAFFGVAYFFFGQNWIKRILSAVLALFIILHGSIGGLTFGIIAAVGILIICFGDKLFGGKFPSNYHKPQEGEE